MGKQVMNVAKGIGMGVLAGNGGGGSERQGAVRRQEEIRLHAQNGGEGHAHHEQPHGDMEKLLR